LLGKKTSKKVGEKGVKIPSVENAEIKVGEFMPNLGIIRGG